MDDRYLIRNTTREEREAIVRESLGECGNCDGCGIARMADMYEDYINGKKEIADITREYNAHFTRG